jgi:hypothetical protein
LRKRHATEVFEIAEGLGGFGGSGGMGLPSATATAGLPTLFFPTLDADSMIKGAKSERIDTIASFLMDEPSLTRTLRVPAEAGVKSRKMF